MNKSLHHLTKGYIINISLPPFLLAPHPMYVYGVLSINAPAINYSLLNHGKQSELIEAYKSFKMTKWSPLLYL